MIFQIIAITILVAFYGCYFIKMFAQKKKGIRTNQVGKGKTGFAKIIEITMKIVIILVPIVEVFSIIYNTKMFSLPIRIVGIFTGIIGVVSFILAVVHMRDSWRVGVSETEKTTLVTNGIYKISRNPAFLGFDLVYVGIILMFFNWILFAISVLAAIMFHFQIVNVEEEFLARSFGEEYIQYKKKVNRYLGCRKC